MTTVNPATKCATTFCTSTGTTRMVKADDPEQVVLTFCGECADELYKNGDDFWLSAPECPPCPACNDQDGPPCPVCGSSEDALYACNLGAGGIDYRCANHLEEVLAAPENEGVTRDDYVAVPASEGRCEACDA